MGKTFGISEWNYISHLEFRVSNGVHIGNVYGAFRYYLYDFGWLGLILLSVFAGIFYSYMYKRLKWSKNIKREDGFSWKVLAYMYFGPSLFMISIADYTYAKLGNIMALFKFFFLAWIIKKLVVDNRFSFGRTERNEIIFGEETDD